MKNVKMEIGGGEEITATIKAAQNIAEANLPAKIAVRFVFNGVTVRVAADSDTDLIYRDWQRSLARAAPFDVGPHPAKQLTPQEIAEDEEVRAENESRCAESQAAYQRETALKTATLKGALLAAPSLAVRNEARWRKIVAANGDDPYSARVIRYAQEWARLMQGQMAAGRTLAECADECSHIADDDGITGFMYGCAVHFLSEVWEHGEALRRWHNLSAQIGTEGEKANETGGVLNPALLVIGGTQ